jgi:hypothetical protein
VETVAAPGTPWTCPSCGRPASQQFCAACGERRPDPHALTLRHFAAHAVEAFTHADSRLWSTLEALVLRPGALTADFLAGRHVRRMAPLQLFLVLNLVFFLALPWVGWNVVTTPLAVHVGHTPYADFAQGLVASRMAQDARSPAAYEEAFNHISRLQAKSLVIVMVPIFALLSAVLLWRWRRSYVEHFVFALHFYAFWLLFQIVFLGLAAHSVQLLARAGVALAPQRIDDVTTVSSLVALAIYLALALRRAYARRGPMVAVHAVALALATFATLQIYRLVLFLTSWLVA